MRPGGRAIGCGDRAEGDRWRDLASRGGDAEEVRSGLAILPHDSTTRTLLWLLGTSSFVRHEVVQQGLRVPFVRGSAEGAAARPGNSAESAFRGVGGGPGAPPDRGRADHPRAARRVAPGEGGRDGRGHDHEPDPGGMCIVAGEWVAAGGARVASNPAGGGRLARSSDGDARRGSHRRDDSEPGRKPGAARRGPERRARGVRRRGRRLDPPLVHDRGRPVGDRMPSRGASPRRRGHGDPGTSLVASPAGCERRGRLFSFWNGKSRLDETIRVEDVPPGEAQLTLTNTGDPSSGPAGTHGRIASVA